MKNSNHLIPFSLKPLLQLTSLSLSSFSTILPLKNPNSYLHSHIRSRIFSDPWRIRGTVTPSSSPPSSFREFSSLTSCGSSECNKWYRSKFRSQGSWVLDIWSFRQLATMIWGNRRPIKEQIIKIMLFWDDNSTREVDHSFCEIIPLQDLDLCTSLAYTFEVTTALITVFRHCNSILRSVSIFRHYCVGEDYPYTSSVVV